jgi:hypothetical protein
MATKMEKEMLESDSDSEDDFFKAKAAGDKVSESEPEDHMELPSLSKRKMRKIKEDGPYAGKNILVFDS